MVSCSLLKPKEIVGLGCVRLSKERISDHKKKANVNIPWLLRWDETNKRKRAEALLDKETDLDRVEFMTMLCELEFH